MASAQIAVSGGVLFFLYRYLLETVGPEGLGLWSMVAAVASVSKLGELGLSGTAVKFVARHVARGETVEAVEVVHTTVVSVAVLQGAVLAGGYPLMAWILESAIPADRLGEALAILPLSLASAWVATLAGVYLSALDGCERLDVRSLATMLSSAACLVLTWILVPRLGIAGIVWAQAGQWGATLLCAGLLLRRELPSFSLMGWGWSRPRFQEMFGYAVKFQVASVFGMLVDPILKGLMAKFGGLAPTAYFEMANRMVGQFRALLMAANQAMVPRVASLHETAPAEIGDVYLGFYRTLFFLSLPLYAGVAALGPLASQVWIGHYEGDFVAYGAAIALAYWLNSLSGPAYFANLGTGRLGWNTASAVSQALLCAGLGYGLGITAGPSGIALAYAISVAACSGLVIAGYHRDHGLPYARLLPVESRSILIASWLGLAAGWLVFCALEGQVGATARAGLGLLACLATILPALWRHPLQRAIRSRLCSAFLS